MRQSNFDLEILQARHREGAFITRRDRSYALDQTANLLLALGFDTAVATDTQEVEDLFSEVAVTGALVSRELVSQRCLRGRPV